mmetsp:Transcript_22440/g.53851  ORF Transcript_22440/g.53851 Transcript_22440/m.53851 type:complete len:320 (+) Transcript_22440:422-1381(+)
MERYFPPLSVITALALDVGFNSLAEPLHAHISIVILITCLQVTLPVCSQVFFFVMFMRTKQMQSGNFAALFRKFRALFVIAPLYMALLLAIRAYRIDAYARSTPWPLVWHMDGYFAIFVAQKVVMILFYFVCYNTLLQLGSPLLYLQRISPQDASAPELCAPVSQRQFRDVPQIIRGSISLDLLNACIEVLNQLVLEKYQLLAVDKTELNAMKLSEESLTCRTQWEQQEEGDTVSIDAFSDQDLNLYPELRGEVGRDMLQILKHLNVITAVKTTRSLTLYAHQSRSGDVQEWAKASTMRRREAARSRPPARLAPVARFS